MILFLIGVFGLSAVSSQLLELEEGDTCRPLGGGVGTCTMHRQCQTLGDFRKNRPVFCGFKGLEPIVCCPTKLTSKVNPGHKTQKYCEVLERKCRDNLGLTKNVVGGKESEPLTHTYMALIGYGEPEEKEWRCGGSLITPRYVLSAAHCSHYSETIGPAKWARLGERDISSNSDNAKPVDKVIIEKILYPDYKTTEKYHDIVLFKLDSEVELNIYTQPICLQTKLEISTTESTVLGWGRIGLAEATSDKLLEADLDIYNNTECERLMFSSKTSGTPRGYQPQLMMCAGLPDGSKDSCVGDSGGPLVIGETEMCIKTQVGITSFGNGCGNADLPGVYTRVSNYISWIEEVAFG